MFFKNLSIRKSLASIDFLRATLFPFFRNLLDFKILIIHPISKRIFFLKFWSHKGCWYYGLEREREEIIFFCKVIAEGDNILEVGAHIGYLTQIFEKISNIGNIIAIEPSLKNFNLLKQNVKKETSIIRCAISNQIKKGRLYVDNYGGFTNTIKKELADYKNKQYSKSQKSKIKNLINIEVDIKTVDFICKEKKFYPDFIKIDVEGAELEVIQGADKTLDELKAIIIEIRTNHSEIFKILKQKDFIETTHKGELLDRLDLKPYILKNYYFINKKFYIQ